MLFGLFAVGTFSAMLNSAWNRYMAHTSQNAKRGHERGKQLLETKERLIRDAIAAHASLQDLERVFDRLEEEERRRVRAEWTPAHVSWTIVTGVASGVLVAALQFYLGIIPEHGNRTQPIPLEAPADSVRMLEHKTP